MADMQTLADVLKALARRMGRIARYEWTRRKTKSYGVPALRDEWLAGWDEADAAIKMDEDEHLQRVNRQLARMKLALHTIKGGHSADPQLDAMEAMKDG